MMRFNPFRAWSRSDAIVPRVYAIGDIHGRSDLLERMIQLMQADVIASPSRNTRVVILGDMIDRGPSSAAVVETLMRLRKEPRIITLKGNHEAAMLDALAGDHAALDMWLAHGGLATLASYGVDTGALDLDDSYRVLRTAREAVPDAVREWMKALPSFVQIGRHYYVHAGIRPGVPLGEQEDADRLWITDEFTASDEDHGVVVVHGHTINEAGVHIAANRIGVDTGAYRTGRLSAAVIEDDREWVIVAEAPPALAASAGGY